MLVDTHAHLTDPRLADDLPGVLERAESAGVDWMVTVASNLADSEATARLSSGHSRIFATVGIHPHDASGANAEAYARLRVLAREPRVVAIGETGLDYHYDHSPRATQRQAFADHLELARDLDLPVVVHCREADDDLAAIVREAGWKKGILHCFSSGQPLLQTALGLGWYVSFAGMITFPKWTGADLLRQVPLDRLLVETDSPYLAPVPFRGKRNEPAFVREVAERAAALRGEDVETVFAATSDNARLVYRVPVGPA